MCFLISHCKIHCVTDLDCVEVVFFTIIHSNLKDAIKGRWHLSGCVLFMRLLNILQCQLSPLTTWVVLMPCEWGKDCSKEQCPTECVLLETLTKVKELFHGQGRRWKLRKPLHLFRYPEDGAIFQQKLSELHFSSLLWTPTVSEPGTKCPFFLRHAPVWRPLS